MSENFKGLQKGKRWWAAECVLRVVGLVSLAGCWSMAVLAHRLIIAPPPHQATLTELLICAGVFLLLITGLAFTFSGPGLFRHYPVPPRSAFLRTAKHD